MDWPSPLSLVPCAKECEQPAGRLAISRAAGVAMAANVPAAATSNPSLRLDNRKLGVP